MKRNEKGNYAPVEGFLEDTLPGISLLHDRKGHFWPVILSYTGVVSELTSPFQVKEKYNPYINYIINGFKITY